jgi:hypothetical protein
VSPAGRPPTGIGPEYQEVLALYEQGVRPSAIALYLGRPRSWVNSAVQSLRKRGAITSNVPTGRAPKDPAIAAITAAERAVADALGELRQRGRGTSAAAVELEQALERVRAAIDHAARG